MTQTQHDTPLPPITQKFFDSAGRLPTLEELELYVSIVVCPSPEPATKQRIRRLKKLIATNNERLKRGVQL